MVFEWSGLDWVCAMWLYMLCLEYIKPVAVVSDVADNIVILLVSQV